MPYNLNTNFLRSSTFPVYRDIMVLTNPSFSTTRFLLFRLTQLSCCLRLLGLCEWGPLPAALWWLLPAFGSVAIIWNRRRPRNPGRVLEYYEIILFNDATYLLESVESEGFQVQAVVLRAQIVEDHAEVPLKFVFYRLRNHFKLFDGFVNMLVVVVPNWTGRGLVRPLIISVIIVHIL
jgi:hypothetical protein